MTNDERRVRRSAYLFIRHCPVFSHAELYPVPANCQENACQQSELRYHDPVKSRLLKEEITYTGEQLRSLFALDRFGVAGDSVIAFVGPSDIPIREIVDMDDQKAGRRIQAPRMLHFIAEHFESDLEKTILRHYLLIDILKDLLNEKLNRIVVRRQGNDLFDGAFKLTITTATASPVSCLFHVGINVIPPAEPTTQARGLVSYNIDPMVLGSEVVERYTKEVEKIALTRCKVRWVE